MMKVKSAVAEQAADLACLINIAGDGIPKCLWKSEVSDNQTAMQLGANKVARNSGGFSYRHARVITKNGQLLGMHLSYALEDPYYDLESSSDYPDFIQPLVDLESQAIGSWYINAIAVHMSHRRCGLGRLLMQDTEQLAQRNNFSSLSLIVSSNNELAYRFYKSLNFKKTVVKKAIKHEQIQPAAEWILMIKDLL